MASTPKKLFSPCGGCTVCCRVLEVEEIPGGPKPANIPCRWLNKEGHNGCSIYPDRPSACQKFECHYIKLERRRDLTTSPYLRPDHSGVMLVHLPSRLYFAAHVYDPLRRDAWMQEPAITAIKHILADGFKVIVTWGSGKRLLLTGDAYGGIIEDELPPLEEEQPNGTD